MKLRYIQRYGRPLKLSNPFGEYDQDCLSSILSTKDECLGYAALSILFSPYLPAGNVDEVLYFVPLAFDFIENNEDGASLLADLWGWMLSNEDQLKKQDAFDEILSEILNCVRGWMSRFVLSLGRDGHLHPRFEDHIITTF